MVQYQIYQILAEAVSDTVLTVESPTLTSSAGFFLQHLYDLATTSSSTLSAVSVSASSPAAKPLEGSMVTLTF